jgi:hypothetical protein
MTRVWVAAVAATPAIGSATAAVASDGKAVSHRGWTLLVQVQEEKPWTPQNRGELVKVLPWCYLRAGQPRIGDWCKVQGDALPLIKDFDKSRYLFTDSAVWVGILFPNGVVCMSTSEWGVFTCGSPAGWGSMGELLPDRYGDEHVVLQRPVSAD